MTSSPNVPTVRAVFDHVEERGLLNAEQREKAAVALGARRAEVHQGIKILTAAGAWLAALAFVIFAMMLFHPEGGAGVVMGLGYCVGATFLRRMARHDFFVQAALAIVLAGFLIAVVSVHEGIGYSASHTREWATSAAAVMLAGVLYIVYDYPLQRLVVPFIAVMILFGSIVGDECWMALHLLIALEAIAILFLFACRTDLPALRPLSFALAVALAITAWPLSAPFHNHLLWGSQRFDTRDAWLSQVTLAFALVWLVIWAARQTLPEGTTPAACLRRPVVLVALGTVLLFAVVGNPALLAGLLLLILGHATREVLLTLPGLLVVVGGLSVVFCDYEFSMTARSGLLVASGLVLLAARFVLWRLTVADSRAQKGAA